jgi:ATP-binding cassette, subfamily C (CFTR/MRP), member 1
MYRVDEGLPRQFNQLFVNITRILFILAIISAGTPIFAVLIIPLALIYIFMQRYYLKTKRELKRLDSTSRSPVFAHFQESLGGITTIRAYVQQERFSLENEERLDANMRAYFPSISANRWLGVRLEFIGSIIIFSAAGFAISSVSTGSGLPTGTVGLVISYALSVPAYQVLLFMHSMQNADSSTAKLHSCLMA